MMHHDVVLTPAQPKQALAYEAPAPEPAPRDEPAMPSAPYVPPQAERPVLRAPRMPRVEDLPVPAQNQLRAQGAEPQRDKRRTLLERLATVGFGRRDEAEAVPQARPAPEAPQGRQPMPPAMQEYAAKRPTVPAPGYRPAQGNLDPQGRAQAPVSRGLEDDQLEIPAFLRRQAN
jgi:cell division protein FtsZ